MANSGLLHLASGAWQLEARPARGGAVTALRHRGRPVLVSPDPAAADAIGAASFPLVPYANRIAHGQLQDHGRQWILPRNWGEHAHPLHGIGWKRAWTVAMHDAHALEMTLQHGPDAHWPWAFSTRQRIALCDDAVRFELDVTNDASGPAPVGVGFHPAFTACAATTLRTQVRDVWLIDADALPVSRAAADAVLPGLSRGAPILRDALVDHCFTEWSRHLCIEHAGLAGDLAVQVTASPEMPFLQVCAKPGETWFCAEPMSQMPDAFHHPRQPDHGGLRMLASGHTLRVWMQIAVD